MTKTEKEAFDLLSDTSYLFRVIFCNAGFDISCLKLNGADAWHLYYENAIVGAITTRKWESEKDSCTFTNLRLYKYFRDKFPKLGDFLLSEYYEMKDDKRVRFNFEKADKYMNEIREAVSSLVQKNEEGEDPDLLSDSIARLREYCDEFDEKFSTNTLFKDLKMLLRDYDRISEELDKRKEDDNRRSDTEEGSPLSGTEKIESSSEDSQL